MKMSLKRKRASTGKHTAPPPPEPPKSPSPPPWNLPFPRLPTVDDPTPKETVELKSVADRYHPLYVTLTIQWSISYSTITVSRTMGTRLPLPQSLETHSSRTKRPPSNLPIHHNPSRNLSCRHRPTHLPRHSLPSCPQSR